jgi:hypothetical protein
MPVCDISTYEKPTHQTFAITTENSPETDTKSHSTHHFTGGCARIGSQYDTTVKLDSDNGRLLTAVTPFKVLRQTQQLSEK